MRYLALAADYDETLATCGRLSAETEAALRELERSGRRLLLLTGRTLEELAAAYSALDLFDCIVLENGGVLYTPSTRQLVPLCPPTALKLLPWLERREVEPVIRGQTLIATRHPHEAVVLEGIALATNWYQAGRAPRAGAGT